MARTGKNVSWNVLEVIASAAILFVSYKIVLHYLGVSALGVWALATAITALSRAADVGASAGTSRSVAVHSASAEKTLAYVETGLLINSGLYLVLGAILFAVFPYLAPLVSKGPATADLHVLMPYVIGSFVMMNVSAVTSSSLIGLYRSDLKSLITILGLAAQIIITWAFIKPLGLRALAIGQVVQYGFMALVSWFVITKVSTGRFLYRPPYRWNAVAARELFGYGMRAQGLNLAGFLFEPTTKFAISAICGVHALGLYELASRGLMQVRQVIVTPSGNLTPLFAKASTVGNRRVARTYSRAVAALAPLSIASMLGLIAISPVLSIIWVGHLETDFIAMTAILATLWSVNLMALPAYYLGLGANRLRWSIWGALATALSSPLLVIALAPVVGDNGAALGAGLAIAIGAIITMRTPRAFGTRPVPRLRYFPKMARLLALALMRRVGLRGARLALPQSR